MAGHSKFKNIMHRKGAQDAKRAKVFTKLGREITVATKLGDPNPENNPRLRAAIVAGRAENMPKDNIDRAIKRGAGNDADANYVAIRYEGYGPGGVGIIVEALTDNRNRTASDVRSSFSKYGGNLGETGSLAFTFDHVGQIIYPEEVAQEDEILEVAIEAGAQDCETAEGAHTIFCLDTDFFQVRTALEKAFGDPKEAKIIWRPKTVADCDAKTLQTLLKLIDVLEDNDDVQEVFSNFEVSDEVMAELTA